jgi:hypothetical protein
MNIGAAILFTTPQPPSASEKSIATAVLLVLPQLWRSRGGEHNRGLSGGSTNEKEHFLSPQSSNATAVCLTACFHRIYAPLTILLYQ